MHNMHRLPRQSTVVRLDLNSILNGNVETLKGAEERGADDLAEGHGAVFRDDGQIERFFAFETRDAVLHGELEDGLAALGVA
jgi:hypothetical protein